MDLEWLAKCARYHAGRMAKLMGVSPRTLEREIAEKFGETPRRWLKRLRLQEAKRLLEQGELGKNIAPEVGFKHPSSFCRAFEHDAGQPPSSFRRHSFAV